MSSAQQKDLFPVTELRPLPSPGEVKIVPVGGTGWAKSSVNAAIFRTNSVITHGDTQYVGFYDGDGNVVLGKRRIGTTQWETRKTQYKGNVKDAHNAISLGIDGRGVLHMSWDMHGHTLHYARTSAPGSLELGDEIPMTGQKENRVTYPQFYALPDGDLLFTYRDGGSGNGNSMLNRYDVQTDRWEAVAHPVVAGGGQRNAYLNTFGIDSKGGVHLSWVWRETGDVATNHDICYAYSPDQGKNWQKSTGEKYTLPITIENAEVVWEVPQKSELINSTSMTVDANDRPVIATYWRDQNSEVPQYRVVWHDGQRWQSSVAGNRTLGFRLSGGGTKRIPISRPQVVAGAGNRIYVIFRDEERNSGISVAVSQDVARKEWRVVDLLKESVGSWEPSYDPEMWKRAGTLHLFVQRVGQGDAETLEDLPPQEVSILEWSP
ncbi:MAG: BNR repeat-containing protein [Armatimonadetes bacterium]|nr:BNR repeat-containing protein [Armatimonadota bacterium]